MTRVRALPWWLLVSAVAVLLVLPKLVFLRAPADSLDEAILLVYPELVRQGAVPHRDFFTVYGPGTYQLLAALFALTGPSVIVERLVGVLAQLGIALGVMRLSRPFGPAAAGLAGVVSALAVTGPELMATAWKTALALTLWSLVLLNRSGSRSAFVSGLLAGSSTYFRFEVAVLHAAALPLVWRDRRRAASYAAGVCLGVAPTLVHLVVAGRAVFDNVVLQRLGLDGQLDRSLLSGGTVAGLLVVLASAAVLVGFAAVQRDRHVVSLALLAVLLLPQALQRIDIFHVAAVGCVVTALAAAVVAGALRDRFRALAQAGTWLVAGTAVLLTVSLTAVFWSVDPSGVRVTREGRSIYVAPAQAGTLEKYLTVITDTVPPGARLFVGAEDMSVPVANLIMLYHLLPEYRVDAYYVEIPDGVANVAGSALVDDIERADALVLTEAPSDLFLMTPPSGRGTEEANEAVRNGFCVVDDLPDGTIWMPRQACRPLDPRPGSPW